ncbi:Inactive serine/threonine-protein kinase VRK3 [Merluccius polli]|uniref:Inactive serine/threonine-protein kinase VRK3 n=1 Tax=Merluccius polli TaxID=89951 RepID=A0AA47N1D4_MERPO|nr:Inactive serine/threonine-protein kinase VRK3 [Merluccius polli]
MPFHFCPQCGTKLQPGFRFCPTCGEQLPGPVGPSPMGPSPMGPSPGPAGTTIDPPRKAVQLHNTSLTSSNTSCGSRESLGCFSPVLVSPRPPLGKTCNSICLTKQEKSPTALLQGVSSVHLGVKRDKAKGRGRPRRGKQVEEEAQQTSRAEQEESEPADHFHIHPISPSPPSPFSKGSPGPGKGKSKKARRVSAVKPLEEGEELTDTACRKWRPGKLLSQTTTDLIYEVFASNSKHSQHTLKLGAKDGRIFNEQNFLQRAAKPSSVDKWIKSTKVDFLGIPSCVGFGLHAENYRFLIFPSMGQTLLSILEDRGTLLSETVVLQLACRILDVLMFIHSNEYVHGNINAENIYIKTEGQCQVFLAGYSHAFRYCPAGQHVEYREASRTPHEGAVEYISVDSHKGAGKCVLHSQTYLHTFSLRFSAVPAPEKGPSQRSDLQSLGYCMLHWHTGTLPWATLTDPHHIGREKQRFMEDVPALLSNCFGKKRVSSAMQQYLTSVMALGYADTPDYATLKAGLHDALLQLGGALEQPLSF